MVVFKSAYRGGRPVRLSEKTREFALESLKGKYGTLAKSHPYVEPDFGEDFDGLSDYRKYDIVIDTIVKNCPVRITENELICGSATLGLAIEHRVPAVRNGDYIFASISHLTCDFEGAVNNGIDFYEKQIDEKIKNSADLTDRQKDFLQSLKNTVNAFHIWHERYLEAAKTAKPRAYEALKRVPFKAPRTFYEAVQSLWFCFAFLRLCGNWPGIGRIDVILGKYLKNDLENGIITVDEAREILASFFIKGCEWIEENPVSGSGDAQHYQNIVLGGIDENGEDTENEVTHLVLDIIEELPIGDFPVTVRINKNTSDRLLTRIAEIQRHGSGVLAVYCEETVINSMLKYGYTLKEARRFANDGCWETQVPGCTCFTYYPFDALRVLTDDVLNINGGSCPEFNDFESLYEAYRLALKAKVTEVCRGALDYYLEDADSPDPQFKPHPPTSAVALFERGCIERALDYKDGGALYTVISPHIGGAPDAGNSLSAIDLLVFREKKVTLKELADILKNNWEGCEALRLYAKSKTGCFGNDNDTADSYTVRILDDFADITAEIKNPKIIIGPGVSTFGRQIEWAKHRTASPFGSKKGDILANNCSPTPGTDSAGATAIILSYCKADLTKQLTGAALDIKLLPSAVEDDNGIEAIKGLLRGFNAKNGYFMQTDVIDAAMLEDAKSNPCEYKTLSVRVAGWNARFVTLDEEWQQMIIDRTAQGI